MQFSITNWLMRKRINAQARASGRTMQHHRVGNPYHAVSIETGVKACAESRKLEGRRFLASAAPMLPLPTCKSPVCKCHYVHYNDRRGRQDRRVLPHNPHAHKMNERREGSGRRMSD